MCRLPQDIIMRQDSELTKKNKNHPSFCPMHHGQSISRCKREQSCEDCKAENTDSKVDPA